MSKVIELAKQAGIRWDAESDCSEWRIRRSELEEFVNVVRNAALEEAAHEFRGLYPLAGDQVANTLLLMKEPTP